jgi:hypothetical protein
MSKKHINITEEVMNTIHDQHIKIRPKLYFILGSVLLFGSLVFSVMSSVFMISLINFSLKTHGPMGQIRFVQLLSSFPWWAPIVAVIGLISGILVLRKYDISYKWNFPLLIVGFILAVLVAGWSIDYFNLDDAWFRQGPMRGIMRQYMQDNSIQPGRGFNRNRLAP